MQMASMPNVAAPHVFESMVHGDPAEVPGRVSLGVFEEAREWHRLSCEERKMKVAVPHHTTRAEARQKVEQKIDQVLAQVGGQADEVHHEWQGDTLHFRGKAKGFSLHGTAEVTDSELIVHSKLPLLAMAFESRIRQTLEREAAAMFSRA
jgi:hypothetical protein